MSNADTTGNGETASRLGDALIELWRTWRLASHPVVKGTITPEQYWLLRRLKRRGALPVSELARGINITNGSATTATKRLERAGFVTRERQDADQRVVLVSLTADGNAAIAQWNDVQRTALFGLVSRASEEEQRTLLAIVEKILGQGE
jgi:MarR family transcriptional regulator, organic hydroperoxide resistance regulator